MAVCALSMLDSMGDEATALGGAVILVLALVLAWLSTHVADRGDHILGTILTVGAHASLIGLGGHDGYAGGAPGGQEPGEQRVEDLEEEDKEEEEEEEEEESGEEGGDESTGDELLDIQGGRKKTSPGRSEEEEEDGTEDEGNEGSQSITVRLKFLNDTEELAVLRPHDTVGVLKSKYFAGRESRTKLIYQGRLLQDTRRTLLSLNIAHNSVLHCHISPATHQSGPDDGTPVAAATAPAPGSSGGSRAIGASLGTGSLVVPAFVVLLAVVWYFRINYRQLFTAPATVSLLGVTVFFSFLIFGMHGR